MDHITSIKYYFITAYIDRFTIETPTEEEIQRQKRYEFYRIIILPWPRYTTAAEEAVQSRDLTAKSYGELIEGSKYLAQFNQLLIET